MRRNSNIPVIFLSALGTKGIDSQAEVMRIARSEFKEPLFEKRGEGNDSRPTVLGSL
jgi:hypothetical protein